MSPRETGDGAFVRAVLPSLFVSCVIAWSPTTLSRANAAIPAYTLVGSFVAPSPVFGLGPDGRAYAVVGDAIVRQDAVNGSHFSPVASLPAGSISAFGASFVRFSPGGHRIAIGDGKFDASASVYVLDADPLSASGGAPAPATVLSAAATPNFDAAWSSDGQLFVTGARASDFASIINRIDLPPGGAAAAVTTVITDVGVGSGGVAVHNGQLLAGCGFLPTGEIRAFDLASLAGPSSTPFTGGTLFGSVLSASPLDFDEFGNLLVGGGDSFSGTSEYGYAAVVDPADREHPLRLSPAGTSAVYSVAFNNATHELLVLDSLSLTVHRYAVPAAPGVGLLAIGGLWAARRRRR